MPYTTIHWVKLEKRLLNDYRFISLTETSQLMYLKFLMLAAETFNKIPKKSCVIRLLFRTTLNDIEIKKHIKEIKGKFPKFKENKHYFYFDEFENRHNWVFPGSSQGVPKEVPEKRREEEDKNKSKKVYNITITNFFKDPVFKEMWEAWLEVRKRIKAPNTNKALELTLKKLEKYSIEVATAMLAQSVERGWRGVFELKANTDQKVVSKEDLIMKKFREG